MSQKHVHFADESEVSHVEYKEVCHQEKWCIMKIVPVYHSPVPPPLPVSPKKVGRHYGIRKKDKYRKSGAPLKGIIFPEEKDPALKSDRRQRIAKILNDIM